MNRTSHRERSRAVPSEEQSGLGEQLSGFNLPLQKLEVFSLVAELGNVTRASERLRISQPSVTGHIRDLEVRLGTTLVARRGRNIVLTESGEYVHRWARDVIIRSLELRREIQGLADGTAGTAIIAASMSVGTYVLPDLLVAYNQRYPKLAADVRISNPRDAMRSVSTGSCDMAVLIRDPQQSSEGLKFERLWDEELVLVAAPNSQLVGDEIDPEKISQLPFVSPPKGLVARDLEDGGLAGYGVVRNNIVMQLGHPEAIKRAIRADFGVGLLFRTAVQDDIAAGTLKEIRVPRLRIAETLFLSYRNRKNFSPGQRRLVEFIRCYQPAAATGFWLDSETAPKTRAVSDCGSGRTPRPK